MKQLQGLGTALITPFKPDGSVDYEALKRLLDKQIVGKVDYFVVLGTTGEAVTLTDAEKKEVRRFIVTYLTSGSASRPVIPLVLGFGGNNTAAVCEALRNDDLTGFSAILSVCPYYNKPSQEGLYQHFCAVAEASPVPVILYNVPGRTGVNLLPETVMRIYHAHPDKVIGIKEASGNLDQIKRLIKLTTDSAAVQTPAAQQSRLMVISGDDGIAAEVMQAGGAGLISVLSNAYPEEAGRLVHDADTALQAELAPLISLLFKEGNPAGIKSVLARQGLISNTLRLPLVPNSPSVQAELAAVMR